MIIGDYNTLTIARDASIGIFLTDEEGNEVLLPKRYVPDLYRIGDRMEVFIYNDSEDRLIATTDEPLGIVNRLAFLEVVSVAPMGAFLDWGLMKDLFVPKKEQNINMEVGQKYLVYIYLDEKTDRLVASSRLDRFMTDQAVDIEKGNEVDIWVWMEHELGYRVIVNDKYVGMIYNSQTFVPVMSGEKRQGYVNQIRQDGRVDVLLQKPGFTGNIEDTSRTLLDALEANDGFLPLTDKSAPEAIQETLQMSKKSFKKAVGNLYKRKIIRIEEDGLRLN